MPPLLHRDGRETRQLLVADRGHVAERKHLRMSGERQIRSDRDASDAVDVESRGIGQQLRTDEAQHLPPRPSCASGCAPRVQLDRGGVDPDDGRVQERCDTEGAQLLLRAGREARFECAEHVRAGLDQQHLGMARVRLAVLAWQHVVCQLGDLAGHLDAGWPRADDDEGQPLLTELVIGLDLGRLEREQDPVTQMDRAFE